MWQADRLRLWRQCSMRPIVRAGLGGAVKRGAGTVLKGLPRPGGNERLSRQPVARAIPASAATWAMGWPVATLRRQHCVAVGHGGGAFLCRKDDSAPPVLIIQAPLPPPTSRLSPHDPRQLGGLQSGRTLNHCFPGRCRSLVALSVLSRPAGPLTF